MNLVENVVKFQVVTHSGIVLHIPHYEDLYTLPVTTGSVSDSFIAETVKVGSLLSDSGCRLVLNPENFPLVAPTTKPFSNERTRLSF